MICMIRMEQVSDPGAQNEGAELWKLVVEGKELHPVVKRMQKHMQQWQHLVRWLWDWRSLRIVPKHYDKKEASHHECWETSREAWEILRDNFQVFNSVRVLQLKNELGGMLSPSSLSWKVQGDNKATSFRQWKSFREGFYSCCFKLLDFRPALVYMLITLCPGFGNIWEDEEDAKM